jgi:hypothetical protein
MHYKRYRPLEAHKHLVDFYWEYEDDFYNTSAYEQSTIASINPKLAFQYVGNVEIQTNSGRREKIFTGGFQGQTDTFGTCLTTRH